MVLAFRNVRCLGSALERHDVAKRRGSNFPKLDKAEAPGDDEMLHEGWGAKFQPEALALLFCVLEVEGARPEGRASVE